MMKKFTAEEIQARKTSRARLVEQYPKKAGRQEYLKYLNGDPVVGISAIVAKCYDCNGGHEIDDEGSADCLIFECPLYPFQPYQQHVIRQKRSAGGAAKLQQKGK
jgi:hypothetical protein